MIIIADTKSCPFSVHTSVPCAVPVCDCMPLSLCVCTCMYMNVLLGLFLLSNYGWYILLCLIILFIVWANVKPNVQRWLKKREEKLEELNFDPARAERFQDGMLKAREKMQKDLEEKATEHQAIVEEVRVNIIACREFVLAYTDHAILV